MGEQRKGDELVQIIIDIPNKNYYEILKGFLSNESKTKLREAIKNGRILPDNNILANRELIDINVVAEFVKNYPHYNFDALVEELYELPTAPEQAIAELYLKKDIRNN